MGRRDPLILNFGREEKAERNALEARLLMLDFEF